MKKLSNSIYTSTIFLCLLSLLFLAGCSLDKNQRPNKDTVIRYATPVEAPAKTPDFSETPMKNPFPTLSVPTYVTKINDLYFLVDCYHDQVIFHHNLTDPLTEWSVMTNELSKAHTIASDGSVYLIDDTENHRILVFEKSGDGFICTEEFSEIGVRPHYIIYDENTETFYAWSSMTGEMYLFRKEKETGRMYLAEILTIPELSNVYVRSFTLTKDRIYFVSGNTKIIEARRKDLKILKEYPVPDTMAGMIQLTIIDDQYLITISTDVSGNQDFATIIQTDDLNGLSKGNYKDVYHNFVGGGTPYYISFFDGQYYLTEHRLPGHSLWSFTMEDGNISNVNLIY